MTAEFRIVLSSKNEGLTYRDNSGDFHFDIELRGKTCRIFLPGTKGTDHQPHHLTPTESEIIIPRLKHYLENMKWFGLIPKSYSAVFVEKT